VSISHSIVAPLSGICFYSSGIMDRSPMDQPFICIELSRFHLQCASLNIPPFIYQFRLEERW